MYSKFNVENLEIPVKASRSPINPPSYWQCWWGALKHHLTFSKPSRSTVLALNTRPLHYWIAWLTSPGHDLWAWNTEKRLNRLLRGICDWAHPREEMDDPAEQLVQHVKLATDFLGPESGMLFQTIFPSANSWYNQRKQVHSKKFLYGRTLTFCGLSGLLRGAGPRALQVKGLAEGPGTVGNPGARVPGSRASLEESQQPRSCSTV